MYRGKLALLVSVQALVCLLLVAGCRGAAEPISRTSAPEVDVGGAVLVLGGETTTSVWSVDPVSHRVTSTVPLRSFALSIDAEGGTFVTAQCGGVAERADRVLGVARDRRFSYVELPAPNPSAVALHDGIAVVVHGIERPGGIMATSTDVASGATIASADLEPMPVSLGVCAGRVLACIAPPRDRGASSVQVCTVDPQTLRTHALARLPLEYAVPIADPHSSVATPSALVVGFAGRSPASRAPSSRVVRVSLRSGAIVSDTRLTGLRSGAFDAAVADSTLAVLDAASAEPTREDAVAFADLRTGKVFRRTRGLEPRAIAAVGSQFVVADDASGGLVWFDGRGSEVARTPLSALGPAVDIAAPRDGYQAE